MSLTSFLVALLMAAAGLAQVAEGAPPAAAASPSFADFIAGMWTVSSIKVSRIGVQALVTDDPIWMGHRLVSDANAIKFEDETCVGPQYRESRQRASDFFTGHYDDLRGTDFGLPWAMTTSSR